MYLKCESLEFINAKCVALQLHLTTNDTNAKKTREAHNLPGSLE